MARNTIGQFIAALRKANGMTQQEVADRLNVSNKAVSRWERDECAPDLSVIPALAEMFGVTCDELLKGERITEPASPERKEQKVEKQVKSLINRTLSSFKTLIWISLAVAVAGLVCMFGISYGFYRPVIGFAVMLLFEAGAFVVATVAVTMAKDVKINNELFEMAEENQVAAYDHTLGSMSFRAYFAILAAILFSLPLVLTTSDYVNSVLAMNSYFTVFFGSIVLVLAVVYLKGKALYMAWITDRKLPERSLMPENQARRTMTLWQVCLTVAASVIFVLSPYLTSASNANNNLDTAANVVGLVCLAASIVCFIVFLIKGGKKVVLPGIRNLLFIPSAILMSNVHIVVWESGSGTHYLDGEWMPDIVTIHHIWNWEYLIYSLVLATVVVLIFTLIETLIKRKAK